MRQHDAAHQADHPRHLGDGDRQNDVGDAGLGQRDQRDREQDRGHRHHAVHDAHDDRVDDPAVAGDQADDEADQRAEDGDADADDQRDAAAVDGAAVDVAAEAVGAEPVRLARRLEALHRIEAERVDGAEPGCGESDERHQGEDREPRHDRGMPAQEIGERAARRNDRFELRRRCRHGRHVRKRPRCQ